MSNSILKDTRKIFINNSTSGGGDPTLGPRVTVLENNEYKITYFTTVATSSGTITIPTGATILLDQFQGGIDAYVSTISNGQPTGLLPQTSGGTPVDVSSFDALGNYSLTGTPSSFPVAIIYILKIKAVDYSNLTIANILDLEEIKTFLTDTQIAVGNSVNTISSSSNFTNTGTVFTWKNSAAATDLGTIKFAQYGITNFPGIYMFGNTASASVPSSTNYAIAATGTDLLLNSPNMGGSGQIRFNTGGTQMALWAISGLFMSTPIYLRNSNGVAGTAPIVFAAGTPLTVPIAGALELNMSDKLLFTIPTGVARKEIAIIDSSLTSGKIAVATTNGRLTDMVASTTGITGATYSTVGGTNVTSNDTWGGYTTGQIVAALQAKGILA